jgi:uroporphyrinogen decarboxylase
MSKMTSMDRTAAAMSHKEPDRVPLFLLMTMHGARELGMSLHDYFRSAENVVRGQVRLREKFHSDCYLPFFYGAIEMEAWGGDVIFYADGPPNAGEPIIKDLAQISTIKPPDIDSSPRLREVLKAIRGLSEASNGEVPVVGNVVSPFSAPIMQMGFEAYIDLLFHHEDRFWELMEKNVAFAIEWANAQLEAGANSIGYADPMSSTTIIGKEKFIQTGFPLAKRTMSGIKGDCLMHFASGRCLGILDKILETPAVGIGVSSLEDLTEFKQRVGDKLTLVGNLDGISMRRWTPLEAERQVRMAIMKGGKGGGFALAENHGEVPFQVPDEVLFSIYRSVEKFGHYPLHGV